MHTTAHQHIYVDVHTFARMSPVSKLSREAETFDTVSFICVDFSIETDEKGPHNRQYNTKAL